MKNNKLTIAISVILGLILLTAAQCSANSPKAKESSPAPFFGGTKGIEAELLIENMVSDVSSSIVEVWDEDSFPVQVLLTNKGEQEVNAHEVKLEIKGISPNDFTGISFVKDNAEKLEPVSEMLPEGGMEYVDFGNAHYNNMVGTFYDATFFVFFTYPYKTAIHIPKVCYKYDIKDTTVCTVNGPKQAFASGGPFAVGTVQERYAGKGKIMLEIPIKNVQKGRAKAFSSDDFKANYDEVRFQMSDPDWECTSRGSPNIARISHPQGAPSTDEVVIRCINDNLEAGALYPKGITLYLDYYYKDWVEKTVRIKKTPE